MNIGYSKRGIFKGTNKEQQLFLNKLTDGNDLISSLNFSHSKMQYGNITIFIPRCSFIRINKFSSFTQVMSHLNMLVQIFWGLPVNNLVKIGKPSKPSSIRKRFSTKFVVQLDPTSSLTTPR